MEEFPLYDDLREKVKNQSSGTIDLRRLCNAINSMKLPAKELKEHYETIFALIYHHELVETKGVSFHNLPYKSRILDGGRGVIFTVKELPPLLQQIISLYITIISSK